MARENAEIAGHTPPPSLLGGVTILHQCRITRSTEQVRWGRERNRPVDVRARFLREELDRGLAEKRRGTEIVTFVWKRWLLTRITERKLAGSAALP